MNRLVFVGAIAFCPEFARRSGSIALVWMHARTMRMYVCVSACVHRIYIGHMPIGTRVHLSSVSFVNLPFTSHFLKIFWLPDEKSVAEDAILDSNSANYEATT